VFLSIAAVTGSLKLRCHRETHIMKCVKCFFPSDQYFETCYTYYGAQTAFAIKLFSLPRVILCIGKFHLATMTYLHF